MGARGKKIVQEMGAQTEKGMDVGEIKEQRGNSEQKIEMQYPIDVNVKIQEFWN